jgi:hypothetical protein
MMGGPLRFSGKRISDQKRLVRGEQLLKARTRLRARDETHHRRWRVLIMAGGAPAGEVAAIRELMPKAHILAVDNDQACLDAAIEAGVDDVVHCDLSDWTTSNTDPTAKRAAGPIARHAPFDLMCLDLCGGVNQTTRSIIRAYRPLLSGGGVLLLTFSYGRDVTELFLQTFKNFSRRRIDGQEWMQERNVRILGRLRAVGIPDLLAGRLLYLFPPSELERISSIMVYRGNEMPMCSVFYAGRQPYDDLSFVQVEDGDFELAVAYPDAASLYDCPQERIEALRRKFAAIKASLTRKERTPPSSLFDDAEAEPRA